MKNKHFIFYILVFCVTNFSFAQNDPNSLTLKDIEIPNAPGFILMDNAPTLIERPNSSKAFSLSILNAIDQSNGIPTNYAIDATPFWYFKHPKMTSYKYIGYNTDKNKQNPFAQLKKISLNFSYRGNRDTIALTPNHNFAFGFRTTLLLVRSKKDIEDLKSANDKYIENLKRIDDMLLEAGITFPIPKDTSLTEYQKQIKSFYEAREKFINELSFIRESSPEKNKIKEILNRKPVLAIDIASGYTSSFLDNSFSQNTFGRFGSWLTASFSQPLSPKKNRANYINLYALGRYIIDGTNSALGSPNINNFDTGGKLEFEFEKISLAYEYIYRFNDLKETYRSNGILKFKASQNIFLTAAFGKNFGETNNLISMLGLNWGIGTGNEKTKY